LDHRPVPPPPARFAAPGASQPQQPVHALLLGVASLSLANLHEILQKRTGGALPTEMDLRQPYGPRAHASAANLPPCSGRWAASSRSCSLCNIRGASVRGTSCSLLVSPSHPTPSRPKSQAAPLLPQAKPGCLHPRPLDLLSPAPQPVDTHSAASRASLSASRTAASSSSRLGPTPGVRPFAYQVRSRPFCQRPSANSPGSFPSACQSSRPPN
jgi:hypothetical protein